MKRASIISYLPHERTTLICLAGHEVPSYQGETSYRIFQRALANLDIATGKVSTALNDTYSTSGTPDTWHIKNELPPPFLDFCYLYDVAALCTEEQVKAIQNGTAEIRSWIVVDKNSTQLFPDLMGASGAATLSNSADVAAISTENAMSAELAAHDQLSTHFAYSDPSQQIIE
jgi:hypothetical protein